MVSPIEIRNAVIESTRLAFEDHSIFTYWLVLDYGGEGQGFGGYTLDEWDEGTRTRVGTAFGQQAIIALLKVVGVRSWEELKGKYVRVKATHSKVVAIGNILREDWFSLDELSSKYFPNQEVEL